MARKWWVAGLSVLFDTHTPPVGSFLHVGRENRGVFFHSPTLHFFLLIFMHRLG